MAKITINIPTGKVQLIKDALGYKDTIINEEGEEVVNPVTAKAFFNDWVIQKIKREVEVHEMKENRKALTLTDLTDIIGE